MQTVTPKKQPKIIAVSNQKGGVGKTTTAINLGAALAEAGCKTLIIDLDPQGNASTGLGVSHTDRGTSSYDLLVDGAALADVSHACDVAGLNIVPATADLSSADVELADKSGRVGFLRKALQDQMGELTDYQFVLIDCPPSLNLLTINAMVAADSILVPLQSEFFALEGLSQLMLTLREVRQGANPDLRIEGIVLTMYDKRNNLSLQVEEDARENLGDLVFKTVIPRNVRLSEAPSFAKPILDYDKNSAGAVAYRALAAELLALNGQTAGGVK